MVTSKRVWSFHMKKFLVVLSINIGLLAALLVVGNTAAAVILYITKDDTDNAASELHLLPNYEGVPWAQEHFADYAALDRSKYHSFYGWRMQEFRSETINIDSNGIRNTLVNSDDSADASIAFFGGSTIWGLGANDATTIPSYFASQNPGIQVTNLGVPAFNAQQSLNLLIEQYVSGARPDIVVFYDGVNDIWGKYRSELGFFSHVREVEIRTQLEKKTNNPFLQIFTPSIELAERIKRKLLGRKESRPNKAYDCESDPQKAEQVARALLLGWTVAKNLVESHGGQFIAVLQPQVFESGASDSISQIKPGLAEQYAAVYPIIPLLLATEFQSLQENFLDLRRSLDEIPNVYIDWCHLSPNGNEIIARMISDGI